MRALLIRAILFSGRSRAAGSTSILICSTIIPSYASELWTSIKEIDGGKILSSVSGLLEVNTKAIKKKLESLCDENTAFAIRDKLDLVKDFCQWPVNYIQGLIG